MRDRKRDTDVKNKLLDSVGEDEDGMIWENRIETCILSYVKQIASPGLMHETGCSGLVHWDDPEGWDGKGGGRGVQDGEHMHTHGWFMSMYGKNHCNPMDSSLPGSSVHGIFQARVLDWVAIYFSRESSWPRDRTWVFCIAGRRFTIWATREARKVISLQ